MSNQDNKTHEHHHHKHKESFSHWLKHNYKFLFILFIVLIFLIAFLIDRNKKSINVEIEDIIEKNKNYDAIITIVDGETESTFTETWGELISDGYPICCDLVTDYVGKEGHMDWETIEALNDVGVEFVFHSSNHVPYNDISTDDVIYDIERGTKAMEEHDLDYTMINWLSSTRSDICKLGYDYFDCGIVDTNVSNTVVGDKSDRMQINDVYGYKQNSYFTFNEFKELINKAIVNNGWVVIFTRNNMMDSTQIDIYRQAFEYAKEHNVAVVTASEGYDLYYGNKLGNNK